VGPDPEREIAELREYLGADYDHRKLQLHQRTVEEEFARSADEASFYRQSEGYLYDLTAFAASGTKLPYLSALTALLPHRSRILDYGCGIGSDGLQLIEAGYEVEFADFDNPSTRYLRWRLRRRGLEAEVRDLDQGPVPAGFDAAFSFDVIEHVEDPYAFLAELERAADLVAVNLLEDVPGAEEPLHRSLPIGALLRRAARGRILHYRIYHRRSHLVIYRPPPATLADRLRSRLALAAGRAREAARRAARGARRAGRRARP
jgi:SAM-dependent methyltransferase